MKTINFFLLSALLFSFAGCQTTPETKHAHNNTEIDRFTGLWTLLSLEQKDSVTGQWSEWRNGFQGYLLYGNDGHMSVHLTEKGYQDFDLVFPNFTDSIPTEALKHITGSYVYFARFTIDEAKQVVEHARMSHSNPADWNKVVKRRYVFSGDTLTLMPLEDENSSLRVIWIKNNSQ